MFCCYFAASNVSYATLKYMSVNQQLTHANHVEKLLTVHGVYHRLQSMYSLRGVKHFRNQQLHEWDDDSTFFTKTTLR